MQRLKGVCVEPFFVYFVVYFLPLFSCRVMLSLVTANHLDYRDAGLHLLGTLKTMQPCVLRHFLEIPVPMCPQQQAQNRLWRLEAPHHLAWSQIWASARITMRSMILVPASLKLPTVFPLQRSSEKKQAVCEISVSSSTAPAYFAIFINFIEVLFSPFKQEFLAVCLHNKNSTLLDASHAVGIHMHPAPNLSTIAGNLTNCNSNLQQHMSEDLLFLCMYWDLNICLQITLLFGQTQTWKPSEC